MTCENGLGVDDLVLGGGVDVPQADGVVVGGRQQVAVEVGVPRQTVALLLVTAQPANNKETLLVTLAPFWRNSAKVGKNTISALLSLNFLPSSINPAKRGYHHLEQSCVAIKCHST